MTDARDRAAHLLAAARRGTEPSAADEARVRSRLHARLLAAPLLIGAKSAHALATGSKLTAAKVWLALGLFGGSAVVAGVVAQHARARASVLASNAAGSASQSALPSAQSQSAVSISAPSTPEPLPASPAPSASVALKRATATPSAAPPSAQDLSVEIAGLRRAQQLLHAGDASAALAALEQLAHEVPKGTLAEERDATRALALCQLGRPSDPRVAGFFSRYPASVHAARVQSACSRGSFE